MMTETEVRLRGCRSAVALSIEILEGTMGITDALHITLPLLNACQHIEQAIQQLVVETKTKGAAA